MPRDTDRYDVFVSYARAGVITSIQGLTLGEPHEAHALDILEEHRPFAAGEDFMPRIVRLHRLVGQVLRRDMSPADLAARQAAVEALVRQRDIALEHTTRWQEAAWELDPFVALRLSNLGQSFLAMTVLRCRVPLAARAGPR